MNQSELLKLLEHIHSGALSPVMAAERLKHLPFEDIGFAKVDHHRALRQGYAEVIFGKGKTPAQGGGNCARDGFERKRRATMCWSPAPTLKCLRL